MKSMLVSAVFFTLTVAAVAVNGFFVNGCLEQTYSQLDALPEASTEADDLTALTPATRNICDAWNDSFAFLSLSINLSELRDCSAALESLDAYTGTSEPADYNAALSAAKVRIKILLERERFSFMNIV